VNLDPVARAQLGSRARQRIITNFSIQQIAARYTDLYLSLAVP
jgi:glycosyltransferase involved in cell wall biosynthesis